jgi:uncharacterized protein YecE (DUF72 family)
MHEREALDPDTFHFRGLHPRVYIGTASDRYAGWLGQVYTRELYQGRISTRTNKIKGKSFKEAVLPVECVAEFFQHFRVLEIDYTFYRTLLDETGKATQNFHVLKTYRDHLATGDGLILKVPRIVFARKILRGGKHVENPLYLSPDVFTGQFYEPAVELLGSHIRGFIFEQEYQRQEDRTTDTQLSVALGKFFEAIPRDKRYHIELRTESYLSEPVFRILEEFGIGQVLSHWTWLPPLRKQLSRANHRFFNSGEQLIIRLMTPIGTRYEDAYAQAHPFDKLIDGMLQPGMIHDTAQLMWESIHQGIEVNVIINNRSGGNAPMIAQMIAKRFLSEQEQPVGPSD